MGQRAAAGAAAAAGLAVLLLAGAAVAAAAAAAAGEAVGQQHAQPSPGTPLLLWQRDGRELQQLLARCEAQLVGNGTESDIGAALEGLLALAEVLPKLMQPLPRVRGQQQQEQLVLEQQPDDAAAYIPTPTPGDSSRSGGGGGGSGGTSGASLALAAAARANFLLAALAPSGLLAPRVPHHPALELARLHRCARAGAVECHLALGDRYLMGRGVRTGSCQRGVWYLRRAAGAAAARVEEEGNFNLPASPIRLHDRFMDAGVGPEVLPWDEAEEVLEMEEDAALRGDAHALRRIGYRRLVGRGLQADPAAAYRDFQAAATGGDAYALFNLGYMHLRGVHVPPDPVAARSYFKRAADRGLAAGHNGLGVMAYRAFRISKAAAAAAGGGGDAGVGASGSSGSSSSRGRVDSIASALLDEYAQRNISAARRHFEAGAKAGNADAMLNLGTLVLRGLGFRRPDAQRALDWYERAYHAGHWRAPYAMALVYEAGKAGVLYDCHSAERLLWQFVAERSSWTQQLRGALADVDAGRHWRALVRYLLLAEQGCEVAAANAGWMLQQGMALQGPAAVRLAASLLQRSSNLNVTSSMVDLAGLLLANPWLAGAPGAAQRQLAQLGAQGQEAAVQQQQQVVEGEEEEAAAAGMAAAEEAVFDAGAAGRGARWRRRAYPVFVLHLPPGDHSANSSINSVSGGDGGSSKQKGGSGSGDGSDASSDDEAPPEGPLPPPAIMVPAPPGTSALQAAMAWLREASDLKDAEASWHLAWLQARGVGMPRDPAAAAAVLADAAATELDGPRWAVLQVGRLLLAGERALGALLGVETADAVVARVLALQDSVAWASQPAAAATAATPAGGGGAGGGAQPRAATQPVPGSVAPRPPQWVVQLQLWMARAYRDLGMDRVDPDSVVLTILLGALAAVLWMRQRQLQQPVVRRFGAAGVPGGGGGGVHAAAGAAAAAAAHVGSAPRPAPAAAAAGGVGGGRGGGGEAPAAEAAPGSDRAGSGSEGLRSGSGSSTGSGDGGSSSSSVQGAGDGLRQRRRPAMGSGGDAASGQGDQEPDAQEQDWQH